MRNKLLLLLICVSSYSRAQVISPRDTIKAYSIDRILINKTGMEVLGGWGIANIVGGGIGYFSAKQDQWKYFHEMNAIWGVINTGIAAAGFAGAKKELSGKLDYNKAYDRYKSNKRLYLVNIGLDVVYTGIGVGLYEYGRPKTGNDQAIYTGFGKSFVMQGVFLLLFDNTMFALHNRYNSRWVQIMQEVQFSGKSIGFTHTF